MPVSVAPGHRRLLHDPARRRYPPQSLRPRHQRPHPRPQRAAQLRRTPGPHSHDRAGRARQAQVRQGLSVGRVPRCHPHDRPCAGGGRARADPPGRADLARCRTQAPGHAVGAHGPARGQRADADQLAQRQQDHQPAGVAAGGRPADAHRAGDQGHQHAPEGARLRPGGGGLHQRPAGVGHQAAVARLRLVRGLVLGPLQPCRHGAGDRRDPALPEARGLGGPGLRQPVRHRRAGLHRPRAVGGRRAHRAARPQPRAPDEPGGLGTAAAQHPAGHGTGPAARPAGAPGVADRPGGLGQDHPRAGHGDRAEHRGEALQQDHRHPFDAAAGGGARLPARHRGGKDGSVAGRHQRQHRGAAPARRESEGVDRVREGARQHPVQGAQLHPRAQLPEGADPDRRVPEPDPAPDEGHHHACRRGLEGDLPG
ncbi:UNVERIFIED_CONTAM: hypothetical protein NCL1_26130 [Trichonephila clavipes]